MNKDQIEYLSKKIVQITNHIQRQIDDKNVMVKGYNTEIKESKKRVNAMAKAVEVGTSEPLEIIFEEFELAEFDKIGTKNG